MDSEIKQAALSAVDLYPIAYRYYQNGCYLEAEKVFKLLTTLDVNNQNYWYGLGCALQMQKKYNDAVDAFFAAALLDESEVNPYPHLYGAKCLFSMGEKNRALCALASAEVIAKKLEDAILLEQLTILKERWSTKVVQ